MDGYHRGLLFLITRCDIYLLLYLKVLGQKDFPPPILVFKPVFLTFGLCYTKSMYDKKKTKQNKKLQKQVSVIGVRL